ncbi:hypothetical protein like AT4G29090 [Hibiscus trionum]|uniref:Reverse transcriptase zinc-binding domain-containing protein n=1 Tax=Hibiscus trionum TaxID=183268 RepID=A0A9W7IF68_HIBTR|nr:hypothetical protein like AT4G29090 [Hibiscus trionum]
MGINVEDSVLDEWAASIGCQRGSFPSEYLGLPLGAKRNSVALWDPVIEKVQGKLSGWKSGTLSTAGRLILVKSVLSALPIYFLSIFPLPSSVGRHLNSLFANFLWGGGKTANKIHWIKWDTVCLPKDKGGLGIPNLKIMNRSLLGRWVWKFGVERESWWKKVDCCKNNLDQSSLSVPNAKFPQASWIWRGMVNNFTMDDEIGSCFRSHLKFKVGRGDAIFFWHDRWLLNVPLSMKFPRLFSLSTNKNGRVADFGSYESTGWVWEVRARRNLADWEFDLSLLLMTDLNNINLDPKEEDSLVWDGNGEGVFTIKSCRELLLSTGCSDCSWNSLVWKGLVPPRVDFFLWQLAHGKVAVKTELSKRGVLSESDINCPVCNQCPESTNHLFIHCNASWKLWNIFFRLWNVSFALPNDLKALLLSWDDLVPKSRIWKLIPGAVLWTVWKVRNSIVFDEGVSDFFLLSFLSRCRIASWFLAKEPKGAVSIDLLTGNPRLADSLPSCSKAKPKLTQWSPPPVGFFKMNVDGAVIRNWKKGGIGGLLRDSDSTVLMSFHEAVGSGPPILAELKAIRTGLKLFLSSVWSSSGRLILESDCSVALEWIKGLTSYPLCYESIVRDIQSMVLDRNVICCLVSRIANCKADDLAKKGIG